MRFDPVKETKEGTKEETKFFEKIKKGRSNLFTIFLHLLFLPTGSIFIMNTAMNGTRKKGSVTLQSVKTKSLWLNIIGIIILSTISASFAAVIGRSGLTGGVLIMILLIAVPGIYISVVYPLVGITVLLVAASFLFMVLRMLQSDLPLGTAIDAIQFLLILGFFIKQKLKPSWAIYNNPISVIIIIWIAYNFVELINPEAESRLAWLYTIRSVAVVMLMYFVFLYSIDTKKSVRIILKIWLALSIIVALYALKQEVIGFFPFEEADLADENKISLLFIAGHWRKFSTYSDPVAFSYNMVISALLCFGLMMGPMVRYKKIILGFLCVFFLIVMLFSGTRGAYVLFPVAMVLYGTLNFSRKVVILGIIGGICFGILIVMPTSNGYIYRFQTAFKPSEDISFKVRKDNQARIRPYIQSHPMGGGLGATGVWGQRFAPNSFLANFPPDSGYARVAVELGWVGLLLICTLLFIALKVGIDAYFKIKDPELKSYCLAMILIIFALDVGNYPQEAFINFPTPFFFYLAMALINRVYILDKEQNMIQKNQIFIKE